MATQYIKICKCEISGDKNVVSYQIGGDRAVMTFDAIDHENIKFFFQLLRTSLCDIANDKVKYIQQYIGLSEWEYFKEKRTSWKIVDSNEQDHLIECPLEDAVENIGIGFGVDKNLQV